jgi:hypothetical protein
MRQSIRRSAKGTLSDLLDSISIAELLQQIEQKIVRIAKHQSGVLFEQIEVPAS